MKLTRRKLKFAWKYRHALWKYRNVIRHRREIAGVATAAAAIAAAVLISRSKRDRSASEARA